MPGLAQAETVPPAQAVADNGVFLLSAPPPPKPAAVCLVDTGVDLNPDTASQVVYREALDGGDPGDVSPDKHGTLMAMMAAAPINGWGMVGVAPGAVKIVSVRVEEPGETGFAFNEYARGIYRCEELAARFDVAAISLSLSSLRAPRDDDQITLGDSVAAARSYGLSVLAAAGNVGGAIGSPASMPQVLAIGGGDGAHMLCPFSNRGPSLALVAPGCGLDTADPWIGSSSNAMQGTSEATAIAAAGLTALRAYAPNIAAGASESLMRSTSGSDGFLDLSAMFAGAGLGQLVTGRQALPPRTLAVTPGSDSAHGLPKPTTSRVVRSALPYPVGYARWRSSCLEVRVVNLPHRATMRVSVLGHMRTDFIRPHLLRRAISRRSRVCIPAPRSAEHVRVRFVDPSARHVPSDLATFILRRP